MQSYCFFEDCVDEGRHGETLSSSPCCVHHRGHELVFPVLSRNIECYLPIGMKKMTRSRDTARLSGKNALIGALSVLVAFSEL